jgi:hypothetical protein
MKAQVERAEERLLDHCTNLGRWLEDSDRASATGRLSETLDTSTIAMLRRGLERRPDGRNGLRRFS